MLMLLSVCVCVCVYATCVCMCVYSSSLLPSPHIHSLGVRVCVTKRHCMYCKQDVTQLRTEIEDTKVAFKSFVKRLVYPGNAKTVDTFDALYTWASKLKVRAQHRWLCVQTTTARLLERRDVALWPTLWHCGANPSCCCCCCYGYCRSPSRRPTSERQLHRRLQLGKHAARLAMTRLVWLGNVAAIHARSSDDTASPTTSHTHSSKEACRPQGDRLLSRQRCG